MWYNITMLKSDHLKNGFYTCVDRYGNSLLYRGYDDQGNKVREKIRYRPQLFLQSKSDDTEWKALDGTPVEPMRFDSMSEVRQFEKTYEGVPDFKLYGNTRHIPAFIQTQFPGEINYSRANIDVASLDIETSYGDGFPEVDNPTNEILTLAYKSSKEDRYRVWGVKPYDVVASKLTHLQIEYRQFESEAEMLHDFIDALDYCDADDRIRAIVITGAGRAFCSGADLSGGENTFKNEFDNSKSYSEDFNRDSGGILTLRMYNCLKPILVACNGPAVGVGATLQLAADIRIASTDASYSFPFARRGIAPDACSSWFLPKIVGISKALEWSYSGDKVSPDEARNASLISYLTSPEDLIAETLSIADKITTNSSPVSIASTRQMMWSLSSYPSPEEAHIIDSKVIQSRGSSNDAVEGVMSFLEKRKATFRNKVSSDMPSAYPWVK